MTPEQRAILDAMPDDGPIAAQELAAKVWGEGPGQGHLMSAQLRILKAAGHVRKTAGYGGIGAWSRSDVPQRKIKRTVSLPAAPWEVRA